MNLPLLVGVPLGCVLILIAFIAMILVDSWYCRHRRAQLMEKYPAI